MDKLFTHYIKTQEIVFKYAKGKSMESGKEFHMYHEIIFFIYGNAEFISEDIHINIKPGTLIIIPKENYHQVIIHGDRENYCRCLINFYDDSAMSDLIDKAMKSTIVIPADADIKYLFQRLTENIFDKNSDQILNAVLVLLLKEIAEKSNTYISDNTYISENSQNIFVKTALKYINSNINKKITINEIAKECMISPSSLSHIFKKEMNIPLHRFIIKKRLINAYGKILSGESATTAAIECGFNDYSGFYKQYKKTFGFSPGEKNTELNKDTKTTFQM